MIKLDTSNLLFDFQKSKKKHQNEINNVKSEIKKISRSQNEMNGWLKWPTNDFYKHDYNNIKKIVRDWEKLNISKFVVIGIGGSYIGIKACLKMCTNHETYSKFHFISSVDQEYIIDTLNELKNENWVIIVISKSGTTLETSLNFRIFREALFKKYKSNHTSRIVAITDDTSGKLLSIAKKHNYKTLKIEKNIGGRYSTLTSVGLLVFKLANLDIDKMLTSWKKTIKKYLSFSDKSPIDYAFIRFVMLMDFNKAVEVFATYNEKMYFISEHYKQIFAETEGKKKCLIPTIANYSVDLHSIGQLYQQGPKNFFETHLMYQNKSKVLRVNHTSFNNDDDLDLITVFNLFELENIIRKSVVTAHSRKGNINCIQIIMNEMNETSFAELIAFLDFSAFASALFLNVKPFDQPGVDEYKMEIKKSLNVI